MSGIATLIKFADGRAQTALTAWQHLRLQCDEAKRKLLALNGHRETYRARMCNDMQQGISANSIIAHVGFINQIEAVVTRQEIEVANLEEGCARLWQQLTDARREKRMYEMLSTRIAARRAEVLSRRGQREVDELMQRSAKTF
jgi:flagellar export protein FliJ